MNLKGRTPAKKLAIKPGVKVAVIDDNEDILTTVPLLLETLGCQVKIAKNAKDGLQLASEFEPDVMLIDIGLPDRSGHDVAARLRADGWKKLLVAISGYSHKEVREKSKKAGFNYHLAKPATLEALTPILAKAK
jgi:CheY-like chemotaxis protein